MKFKTEEELLAFTEGIIGKSFKEIDTKGILQGNSNDKGILGKVVETGFYDYELNNCPEADFGELGIELKVSGFNKLRNGLWSAKERISLSMINCIFLFGLFRCLRLSITIGTAYKCCA